MPKKKWIKPMLIVLVRGKPEERILVGCKAHGGLAGAVSNYHLQCGWSYPYFCQSCDLEVSS